MTVQEAADRRGGREEGGGGGGVIGSFANILCLVQNCVSVFDVIFDTLFFSLFFLDWQS